MSAVPSAGAAVSAPTLHGHVLTPGGGPVGTATLTIRPAAAGQPVVVGTDAAGAFSTSVPDGTYTVTLAVPDPVGATATVPDVVVRGATDLVLVARRARPAPVTVSGSLRDRHGVPLPGALVELINAAGRTVTDGAGRFSMSVRPGTYAFFASLRRSPGTDLPDEMTVADNALVIAGDRVLDLTIPTRDLNVSVTDGTGQGVGGATVRASAFGTADLAPGFTANFTAASQATADAGGTAQIVSTAADTTVTVDPPAASPLASAVAHAPAGAGADADVPVVLPEPVTASGVIHDASGAPIAGQIALSGAVSATAESDAQGNWSARVPPGSYQLLFSNQSQTAPSPFFRLETLPLNIDGSTSFSFTVPTVALRVHERDGAGQPVAGAQVRALPQPPIHTIDLGGGVTASIAGLDEFASTDVNGDAVLNLFAGLATVRAEAPDGSPLSWAETVDVPVAPGAAVEQVLPARTSWTGVLRGRDGLPVSGAHMSLGPSFARHSEAVTGPDGRFTLSGGGGDLELVVDVPDQPAAGQPPSSYHLSATLRLPTDRTGDVTVPWKSISVRAFDGAGSPMSAMSRAGADPAHLDDVPISPDLTAIPFFDVSAPTDASHPAGLRVLGGVGDVTVDAPGIVLVAGDVPWQDGTQVVLVEPAVHPDVTAPAISVSLQPPPNSAGWNHGPVTATFACSDADSGIASCPGPVTIATAGLAQPVSGEAVDKAGNRAVATALVNIDVDPPDLITTTSPAPINGWFRGDVAMSFTCTDLLSGVDSCPASVLVGGEGAGISVPATAFDRAGNATPAGTIAIDRTAPSVTLDAPGGRLRIGRPGSMSGSALDGLSGVAAVGITLVPEHREDPTIVLSGLLTGTSGKWSASVRTTAKDGRYHVTLTATDRAGNVTTTAPAVRVDIG